MSRDTSTAQPGPIMPVTRSRSSRAVLRRFLVAGMIITVFAAAALLLSTAIQMEVGTQATFLGVLFAVLPLGLVLPSVLWLDRFEAEPVRYLLFAFGWGALIATTIALVLNTASMVAIIGVGYDDLAAESVASVIVAPVVEETLKALAVVLIFTRRRHEFDGIVDGIVYAAVSATGFAFAENILYLGRAFADLGAEGLVGVFVVRGLLGPFAHPLFTMWTGLGIGYAASRTRGLLRWIAPVLGLAAAIGLHALWNLSAYAPIEGFWTSYLFLQMPIFVGAVAFVVWLRRREAAVIAGTLTFYAGYGWLSTAEVRMLASMAGRRDARRWALRTGGRRALRTMSAFQDDASELAMLRRRMVNGTAGPNAAAQERILLDTLSWRRAGLP